MQAATFPLIPTAMDYTGVAVFALTGALAAARDRHDIITFLFFAVVTGVGGGTLRDLLIGAPVFWIADPAYVAVGGAAAVAVWLLGARIARSEPLLLWLDAVGLAIYAVMGAGKALSLGVHPLIAVAMGVLTATFGGVLRDVLAGQPSILLKREIYVTAALVGASVFVAAYWFGVLTLAAAAIGVTCGFIIRAGALIWHWRMPAFGAASGGDGGEARDR